MLLITWDAYGKKYSVGKSTQDVNKQVVGKTIEHRNFPSKSYSNL